MRTLGGPPIEMAKALGASPAVMPMPDLYQALDKGVFDGAAVPWEAIHAFRLYEVAKNVTMVPFYASYFSLCANRQKIQSLPKDVRDQIMSVSGLAGSKFWGKNFFDTAEQGVEERVKAAGITLNRYDVPSAEVARWKQGRRRAAVGGVGEEDGGQGPQGGPRHPQFRARTCQEMMRAVIPGRARSSRPEPGMIGALNPDRNSLMTESASYDAMAARRCELVLLYIGVLATFAMMCLTSADALSRYALQSARSSARSRSPRNT